MYRRTDSLSTGRFLIITLAQPSLDRAGTTGFQELALWPGRLDKPVNCFSARVTRWLVSGAGAVGWEAMPCSGARMGWRKPQDGDTNTRHASTAIALRVAIYLHRAASIEVGAPIQEKAERLGIPVEHSLADGARRAMWGSTYENGATVCPCCVRLLQREGSAFALCRAYERQTRKRAAVSRWSQGGSEAGGAVSHYSDRPARC